MCLLISVQVCREKDLFKWSWTKMLVESNLYPLLCKNLALSVAHVLLAYFAALCFLRNAGESNESLCEFNCSSLSRRWIYFDVIFYLRLFSLFSFSDIFFSLVSLFHFCSSLSKARCSAKLLQKFRLLQIRLNKFVTRSVLYFIWSHVYFIIIS